MISEPFQFCCRLLLLTCFFPVSVSAVERLYIAPNGNDDWAGRLAAPNDGDSDGPLATLEAAREHIRKLRITRGLPADGVIVELAAGVYERDRTFELTADDSGTTDRPIIYRAAPGANVRLIGGKVLYDWKKVSDPDELSRLDPTARDRVVQTDLKARGITDFGQVGGHGIELFFQDLPAQLARWPNEEFTKIRDVTAEAPTESHGRKGSKVGAFYYDGDRPKRWLGERDLWLHGYWFWDWSDAYQQVAEVDPEQQLIRVAKPDHNYGYRAGARYYALNAFAELDTSGEWQLNRQTGTLYFWPPAPVASGCPTVSVLQNLISLRNTSNVSFEKLTFESARGTAVKIAGGTNARIVGCTIRNTGDNGVEIENGRKNAVIGCDIYNTAAGGIVLAGGDRATLAAGENLAENNHIHHYARWKRTYAPAITVSGVGNLIRHNLFCDAPHNAIQLSGNEHLVEFNEFHHVCLETDDVGAFYMGRDWTQRGNVVQYNYFHHLGKFGGGVGVMAVYLDDWSSGATVFGNVCYKAGRAVLVGGGRDNLVENNVFVDCTPSVHVDSRGLGWAKSYFDNTDNTLVDRLQAIDYRHPPWSTRYPQLLTLYADEPALAKGNVIARNISVGGRWLDLADGLTDRVVKLQDNLVDADPHFVDREKEDFRLQDDSPAFARGFKPIAIHQIGLYPSDSRASWPVAGDTDANTPSEK